MRNPGRILVAEDETLVAEMVQGLLEDLGYTVAGVASTGERAVALARELSPDAILMDIKMPDCDGLEAAQRIADNAPAPIVILTAFENPEVVRKASAAGVGAYLTKPPSPGELDRALTIAQARFADLMELRQVNEQLRSALATVKQLSGLLPICSRCKRIRDGHGGWQQLEQYIQEHSAAEFTHGICPDCSQALYPQYSPPR